MAIAPEKAGRPGRRSTKARGSRSPIPTMLQPDPGLEDVLTVNFGPNHPVHARRAAADRRPPRRGRGRAGGRGRLPAHRLREEHGAEDLLEGGHVRAADGLPRLPGERVRLRRRGREAARDRGAAEGGVDADAAARAEPDPLAPDLARHGRAGDRRDRPALVLLQRAATTSSTSSSWSAARECTPATSRPAGSRRTSRPASSRSAGSSSTGSRTRSTCTSSCSRSSRSGWSERAASVSFPPTTRSRSDSRGRCCGPPASTGTCVATSRTSPTPSSTSTYPSTSTATSTTATGSAWTRCASR